MNSDEKRDPLRRFGPYLNALGGLAAILVAIGYISVRYHNAVLGIELDVAAGDYIYVGGMFLFNTFFAILLAAYKHILGTGSLHAPFILFTLFVIYVLKNYMGKGRRQLTSLLWAACGALLLVEGCFVIFYFIKSMPEQNTLYLGKNPYNQAVYGSLALIVVLYAAAFWNLHVWQRMINLSSFFVRPIFYLCGFFLLMLLIIVPVFYGGLSNPNRYPIMIFDYNGVTYKVAILGERDERLVAYDYPLKKVLLLDRDKIQKMECLGIRDIFDPDNYNGQRGDRP